MPPPITLTIDADHAIALKRILLRLQASELSDLRRAQTQLSVYGERRASMDGEPAAIEARLGVVSDLIAQIETQTERA